jgi:hypothetical protein
MVWKFRRWYFKVFTRYRRLSETYVMKRFLVILFLVSSIAFLYAQDGNKYDLLTEPYVQRPFTLHKGFIQLNGAYSHILGNNYFDIEGAKLNFNEVVRSMIEDDYHFSMGYGILELLEFRSNLTYRNRYESLPTYFVSNNMSFGTENTIFHSKGFSNLSTRLNVRTPVIFRNLQFYASGGLILPIFSQNPRQPNHTVTLLDPSDPGGSYELNYEFNAAPDIPAMFYHLGVGGVYSNDKIQITIRTEYESPFSETETYSWDYRLYGSEFEYIQAPYSMRSKGSFYSSIVMDLQLFPWFAVSGGYSNYQETPGWSDQSGQKVLLTKSSFGNILLGFEIQVSTHLRMNQQVYIPVSGRNTYSEFHVLTGLVYSFAPFAN